MRHVAARSWTRSLRPLEVKLAVLLGLLSGVGWAVITGAHSSPLARVGFFLIGAPIGVFLGMSIADEYLDSGPRLQRFIRLSSYVFVSLLAAFVIRDLVRS